MGLLLHLVELVGKYLEGDGQVLNVLQHLSGETLVIRDARLAHEGGVRGKPFDVGLLQGGKHVVQVGAVRIDFDLQFIRHVECSPF